MYLTKNQRGEVVLFDFPPRYVEELDEWWENELGGHMGLVPEFYPEVTFENSPKEVELKLIEK